MASPPAVTGLVLSDRALVRSSFREAEDGAPLPVLGKDRGQPRTRKRGYRAVAD